MALPTWVSAGADERARAAVPRWGGGVAEDAILGRETPGRIEDDAQRVGAGNVTRGELRVVGRHRARADDDRVAERAHAVEVQDVLVAGDELRIARVAWQ